VCIEILSLMFNSSRWEDRIGALSGAEILAKNPKAESFIWEKIMQEKMPNIVVDEEYKVR
jgi:hypothetical protein